MDVERVKSKSNGKIPGFASLSFALLLGGASSLADEQDPNKAIPKNGDTPADQSDYRKGETAVPEQNPTTAIQALRDGLTEVDIPEERFRLLIASSLTLIINILENENQSWQFVKGDDSKTQMLNPAVPLPPSGQRIGLGVSNDPTLLSKLGLNVAEMKRDGMAFLVGAVSLRKYAELLNVGLDFIEDLENQVEFKSLLVAYRKAKGSLQENPNNKEAIKEKRKAWEELSEFGHRFLFTRMVLDSEFERTLQVGYEETVKLYYDLASTGLFNLPSIAHSDQLQDGTSAEFNGVQPDNDQGHSNERQQPSDRTTTQVTWLDDDIATAVSTLLQFYTVTEKLLIGDRFRDLTDKEQKLAFIQAFGIEKAVGVQTSILLNNNPNTSLEDKFQFESNVRAAAELIFSAVKEDRRDELMEFHPGQLARHQAGKTEKNSEPLEAASDLTGSQLGFNPSKISTENLIGLHSWHRKRLLAMVRPGNREEFNRDFDAVFAAARTEWTELNPDDPEIARYRSRIEALKEKYQKQRISLSSSDYQKAINQLAIRINQTRSRKALESQEEARDKLAELLTKHIDTASNTTDFDRFLASVDGTIKLLGDAKTAAKSLDPWKGRIDKDYDSFLTEKASDFGLVEGEEVIRATRLEFLEKTLTKDFSRLLSLAGDVTVPRLPTLSLRD